MNPKNFEIIEGSEFYCDSCKNEKTLTKFLNNNDDQMGMLAFSDDLAESQPETQKEEPISPRHRSRPQSILGMYFLILLNVFLVYSAIFHFQIQTLKLNVCVV